MAGKLMVEKKKTEPEWCMLSGKWYIRNLLPAHSETPSRINEASRIRGKGTSDREQDGHLPESMDGAVQHDTDDHVGNQNRRGTAISESAARTNKETST